jgi:hypothetical protein
VVNYINTATSWDRVWRISFTLGYHSSIDSIKITGFVTAMIVGTFIPSIMAEWSYMFKTRPGLKLQ